MKDWHAALQLIAVGWYIALSLLIPFGIGLWLDKTKFHSFPRLTFTGIGVGTVIMVFGVYKMLKEIMKAENKNSKNK
jgi:hypothetical protein